MLKKVILKVPKQQFCSKKYFKNFSKKVSLLKRVNELKKKWLRKVYSNQKLLKKVTNTKKKYSKKQNAQKSITANKSMILPFDKVLFETFIEHFSEEIYFFECINQL